MHTAIGGVKFHLSPHPHQFGLLQTARGGPWVCGMDRQTDRQRAMCSKVKCHVKKRDSDSPRTEEVAVCQKKCPQLNAFVDYKSSSFYLCREHPGGAILMKIQIFLGQLGVQHSEDLIGTSHFINRACSRMVRNHDR